MKSVLICDDEKLLCTILGDFFRQSGFQVYEAYDGEEGFNLYKQHSAHIDVAILDVMMPKLDGFSLCQKIRDHDKDISIIILTAKNGEEDELRSFEVGADDFIPKPLRPSVVCARVEALLKRKKIMISDVYTITINHELVLIPNQHEVYVNKKLVDLGKKEYEILLLLHQNKNNILSRDQIIDALWGNDSYITDRTIDTHITRIRSKLNLKHEAIKTVRGYGYTLEVKHEDIN